MRYGYLGYWFSVLGQLLLVVSGGVAVATEVADVLVAIAAVTTPIAKVAIQVSLVPASLADILTALLARGVTADLSRVLPQLTTILPNFTGVAANLAGVMMDFTLVRTKLARFAMRHTRVQRRVRVVDTLCAHELRTSNEQGCGNGSHSEIAHGISQRQDRALAAMACAACTTVAHSPTLSASSRSSPGGRFFRSIFPDATSPFRRRDRSHARPSSVMAGPLPVVSV